jgi:anti-anti-sigma factor
LICFEERPAILRCAGEEDQMTCGRRREALTRAKHADCDVVVDLSELDFADPSLMIDFAMLSRNLRMHDRRLRLRGAQPQIRRLIEMVGLDRLPGVQVEGTPALS